MKTENFLGSSAHPLKNSEGANLCFRNPWAQFKSKKKNKKTLPAGNTVFLSCLFQWSPGCSPQPLWHGGNITFKSLCTISCWWMWFTLSSIWWIQWLQDKGRDTELFTNTHNNWHLISSQNYFPNFSIGTRESSRPQAESLHHAHWMPQLSSYSWTSPAPLSNKMLNILFIAGPQSLSPTSRHPLAFLPITISISLVPSANGTHPTQENKRTRVSANSSQDWASKTQLLQETFSWASPKQRINFLREQQPPLANSGWRLLGSCQLAKLSEQHLKHFTYTMCAHTRLPFKYRSHLRG